MDELIAFVRAQLDEDERDALAASANDPGFGRWEAGSGIDECRVTGSTMTIYDEGGHDEFQARHIARWDPARVLAEVEAKRVRLDWIVGLEHEMGPEGFPTYDDTCRMLIQPGELGDIEVGYCSCGVDTLRKRLLGFEAQPYAERPGWREEWRV